MGFYHSDNYPGNDIAIIITNEAADYLKSKKIALKGTYTQKETADNIEVIRYYEFIPESDALRRQGELNDIIAFDDSLDIPVREDEIQEDKDETVYEGKLISVEKGSLREKIISEAVDSIKKMVYEVALSDADKIDIDIRSAKLDDNGQMEITYRADKEIKTATVRLFHDVENIQDGVLTLTVVGAVHKMILVEDLLVATLTSEKLGAVILDQLIAAELEHQGYSRDLMVVKAHETSDTYIREILETEPADFHAELHEISGSWDTLFNVLSIHADHSKEAAEMGLDETRKAQLIINELVTLGLEYLPYDPADNSTGRLPEEVDMDSVGIVTRDSFGNVIARINPSKGLDDKYLFLQGHMDMVMDPALKEMDWSVPVQSVLVEEDGEFRLEGVGANLGIDNGVGIAASLILAKKLIEGDKDHAGIEMVFTMGEEKGLLGAQKLDMSQFRSSDMVNLDSGVTYDGTKTGRIVTDVPGGVVILSNIQTPEDAEPIEGFTPIDENTPAVKIEIKGGLGGHSGGDFDKGRINAVNEMVNLTKFTKLMYDAEVVYFSGGDAFNKIPNSASAVLLVRDIEKANRILAEFEVDLQSRYEKTDPGVMMTYAASDIAVPLKEKPLTDKIIDAYNSSRGNNAVQEMINRIAEESWGVLGRYEEDWGVLGEYDTGVPKTAINLGVLKGDALSVEAGMMLRSGIQEELDKYKGRYSALLNGEIKSEIKVFNSDQGSPLILMAKEVIERITGRDFKITGNETGEMGIVEMGLLSLQKNYFGKTFNGVMLGPDCRDLHSKNESMKVSSFKPFLQWVVGIEEAFTARALSGPDEKTRKKVTDTEAKDRDVKIKGDAKEKPEDTFSRLMDDKEYAEIKTELIENNYLKDVRPGQKSMIIAQPNRIKNAFVLYDMILEIGATPMIIAASSVKHDQIKQYTFGTMPDKTFYMLEHGIYGSSRDGLVGDDFKGIEPLEPDKDID
ncbi:M20/M25/M40 family metallo-hydrolase, partial [Elusimicrobiota bacterium]